MTDLVRTYRCDGILHVVIDRPEKRNALSRATLEELSAAFDPCQADEDLRLAILTGAGEKSFAAGGDLSELASVKGERAAVEMATHAKVTLNRVREFPLPVIARLNGDALGGGAELAVACDLRVAASHARIGFIQGRLGITSAWGGGVDLIRLLGTARAMQMMTRTEVVNPVIALDCGLYNAVTSAGQSLDDAIEEFIEPMRNQSPHVMRAFKELSVHARRADRDAMDIMETQNFARAWAHPDHDIAVARLQDERKAR